MVEYSVYTNIGSRKVNEDAVKEIALDGNFGFIVCDGLGGQGMGDAAAKIVANCFCECFERFEINESFLPKAFDYAQNTLLEEKNKLNIKNQMCTTAVALAINENTAYVGYIGDSRLYFFESGELMFKTLDHSLPQMLALSGEINEEDIYHHPDRNKLLRAFGTEWDKPMYAIAKPIEIKNDQAFLLCTDGFWEWIDTKTICDSLAKSNNAEKWLSNMVEIVKKKYVVDNYSAIAVMKK